MLITIMIIVLSAFSSCRAISSLLHDDGVVAQVGDVKLYRAELDALIPKGLSQEDSVNLARQYINTWASDLVYLKIAYYIKARKFITKRATSPAREAREDLSLVFGEDGIF